METYKVNDQKMSYFQYIAIQCKLLSIHNKLVFDYFDKGIGTKSQKIVHGYKLLLPMIFEFN